MITAIIFDCDGVVIDSEPLLFEATAKVFARHGVVLQKTDVEDGIGAGAKYVSDPKEKYGLNVEIKNLMQEREAEFRKLAVQRLKPFPYFFDLIKNLKEKKLRIALASSAETEVVRYNLNLAGIDSQLFDVIVDSSKIKYKKPAPDIFLQAADDLGVPPAECLVVEDAPAGVEAAKSAGMYVIALGTSVSLKKLAAADKIVNSVQELYLRLDSLLN